MNGGSSTSAYVAGEPSGDLLGAGLMHALRARVPDVRFRGVGGPLMLAAGLEALAPMSTFAMNGFVEPVKRFPRSAACDSHIACALPE